MLRRYLLPRPLLSALLLAAALAGCSLNNRTGPDVTCADLGNRNACTEGIIASCVDGSVAYEVCTQDDRDVAAEDWCHGSWQVEGAYSCTHEPAVLIELNYARWEWDKPEPGSSGHVSVGFRNLGGRVAGAQVTVFTDDEHVSLECSSTCSRMDWEGLGHTYGFYNWLVSLDASAPRTPLRLQAVVVDRSGGRWSYPFDLEVGELER